MHTIATFGSFSFASCAASSGFERANTPPAWHSPSSSLKNNECPTQMIVFAESYLRILRTSPIRRLSCLVWSISLAEVHQLPTASPISKSGRTIYSIIRRSTSDSAIGERVSE